MRSASRDAEYFERIYADNTDPWHFTTSAYERAKYDETLRMLGSRTFENALEIGCAIGVFTAQLAKRCRHVLAVDISERALQIASQRCKRLPNVAFARMAIPDEFTKQRFDLIVLSEVAYFWCPEDLLTARERIADGLMPAGALELVHLLPDSPDLAWGGDVIHEAFLEERRLLGVRCHRWPRYRIDVLIKDTGAAAASGNGAGQPRVERYTERPTSRAFSSIGRASDF